MFPHVIPTDQDLIECVEGARRLRDVNIILLDEWEKWSSQVREAIEYLYEKGLVWGDAKAANVLVGQDGKAIIIDRFRRWSIIPVDELIKSITTVHLVTYSTGSFYFWSGRYNRWCKHRSL